MHEKPADVHLHSISVLTGVTTYKQDGSKMVQKGNNRILATLTTTQAASRKSASGNLPADFEV